MRIRGKCCRFVEIWFTFPEKTAKMAVESIFSRGKCLEFPANWFTFHHQANRPGKLGNRTEGLDVFATANDFTNGLYYKPLPGRKI